MVKDIALNSLDSNMYGMSCYILIAVQVLLLHFYMKEPFQEELAHILNLYHYTHYLNKRLEYKYYNNSFYFEIHYKHLYNHMKNNNLLCLSLLFQLDSWLVYMQRHNNKIYLNTSHTH